MVIPEFTFSTSSTVSVTISGLAFDTGIPVPISSGGSIAIKLGFNAAAEALTLALLVHTTETRLSSFALLIVASIFASFKRRSEWLMSVPTAPIALIASGKTCPVKLPGFTGSTC